MTSNAREICFVIMLTSLVFTGCAHTPQSVLAPYVALPTECAAIDAELRTLARKDATTANTRTARDVAVLGVSVAAAVGSIPAAWVGVPVGLTLLNAVTFGSNDRRIGYLAYQRAYRGCQALDVN